MPKVFIVGGGNAYQRMFEKAAWEVVNNPQSADLIQFTGGEDVTPSLYGETTHPTTGNNPQRDSKEIEFYKASVVEEKKIAGICRGGQFLNVMNHGKLWQHVNGHALYGTHACLDVESGQVYQVTSTHHQMMIAGPEAEILGIAKESTFKQGHKGGKLHELVQLKKGNDPDLEVVFYPSTNTLCFQPHPEFPRFEECTDYYFYLLASKLGLAA